MSFAFIHSLIIITAVNFIVVFGGTMGFLYVRDKITAKKEEEE
jgi:hypothetical protein